jgi:hypothetical protein
MAGGHAAVFGCPHRMLLRESTTRKGNHIRLVRLNNFPDRLLEAQSNAGPFD